MIVGVMVRKKRIHYKCKLCPQIISNLIFHLENHHDFNGHELFMMEEEEPEKFKEFIEKNYTKTDEQISSLSGKKRAK